MVPSQLFGIVIRSIGLILFIYTAGGLAFGLEEASEENIRSYVALIGILAFALYLLRGAPKIVRFCYHANTDGPNVKNA